MSLKENIDLFYALSTEKVLPEREKDTSTAICGRGERKKREREERVHKIVGATRSTMVRSPGKDNNES